MLVNLALKHACAVPEVSRQVASIAQTSRQALQPAGSPARLWIPSADRAALKIVSMFPTVRPWLLLWC